jgi:protoporphyrinogen oxidase
MKIAVIGAGISGLSVARLLRDTFDVTVFEKNSYVGGIAYVKDVAGMPYHITGGHCLNSKHKEVMDFVFCEVLPLTQWHKILRQSVIYLNNRHVSYPIEFSVKQMAEFDAPLAMAITRDLLNAPGPDSGAKNLKDWFVATFGQTLAELYFIPYNGKIWNRNVEHMSPDWVLDKLPIPSKQDFFAGLLSDRRDAMPHASFFYPNTNTQNSFTQALAKGTCIHTNAEVLSIDYVKKKYVVNGGESFDLLINTAPLKYIIPKISGCPADIVQASEKLLYNKVSTVFWESEKTENTWVYYPERHIPFHRQINIGSFLMPASGRCMTECIGETAFDSMTRVAREKFALIEPLDRHVSGPAYVVYDQNRSKCLERIFSYLKEKGMLTLGRFGEWEYYNMDICILKAIETANLIKSRYQS